MAVHIASTTKSKLGERPKTSKPKSDHNKSESETPAAPDPVKLITCKQAIARQHHRNNQVADHGLGCATPPKGVTGDHKTTKTKRKLHEHCQSPSSRTEARILATR